MYPYLWYFCEINFLKEVKRYVYFTLVIACSFTYSLASSWTERKNTVHPLPRVRCNCNNLLRYTTVHCSLYTSTVALCKTGYIKSVTIKQSIKLTKRLVVTTQPNFNSTQSNFNPGWGYMVTGLHTTHPTHPTPPHPPLTFKLDPDNIGECNFKTI